MLTFLLQTLWLERTTIYTKFTFPGILCWFETTHTETVCISLRVLFSCLILSAYSAPFASILLYLFKEQLIMFHVR